MKKIILFVVLIAIVLGGVKLIKSKSSELESAPTAQKPIFIVNVVTAEQKTVKETSSFLAKLESNNAPKLTTKVSGFIEHVHVSENQLVKKGDLLVVVDSKELRESLNQIQNSIKSIESSIQSVQATLASLKNDFKASKNRLERNTILYKTGGLSKEKHESSEVEFQLKKAKLDSTLKSIEAKKYELKAMTNSYHSKKATLDYYNIKSPINGFVDSVLLKSGDMALPGKTILTLLGDQQKLTFSFSEARIKKGLHVTVDSNMNSKITKILKSTNNLLYHAQIDLNTSLDLPIGSFVNVEVHTNTISGSALPINTILHRKDAKFVVIYENGAFKFQKVEILVQDENHVITKPRIEQKVALASESKLAILPSSDNYKIVER